MINWFKSNQLSSARLAITLDEKGFAYALIENHLDRPFVKDFGFINCISQQKLLGELKKICFSHNFHGYPCTLILPHDRYSFYLLDLPDIRSKDLSESLKWRVKDYLEYPVEDAVLDYIELPKSTDGPSRV